MTDKGTKVYNSHKEGNPKGVWLSRKRHEPQGGMILWRYPGGRKWRLALAYKTVSGSYKDCGGAAGGSLKNMTDFMEIPE